MSYGFFNPFIDGKIYSPSTTTDIGFSLFEQENDFLRDLGQNALYVSSGQLVLNYSTNIEMSVTLTPPYEDAVQLVNESPYIRFGNTMYFRWGYNDGFEGHISDWYIGFMQLPEINFGEDISITLKATGFGHHPNRVSRLRVWSTPESPRTFKDVVEEIAKKYGFSVHFDLLGEIGTKMLIQEERVDLVQGGFTDLQFIEQKARQAQSRLLIRGSEMHFVDVYQPLPWELEVGHEFHMYGKMDPENGIFPMTGFSPEEYGVLFLPQNQGLMSMNQGPNDDPTADPVPVTSNNAKDGNVGADNFVSGNQDLNTPGTDGPTNDENLKSDVAVDTELMEAGKQVPIPMSNEFYEKNVESMLDGVRQDKAEDLAISVNFETVGIPTLIPGMLTRLRGVTKYFECDYMVKQLTLDISSGGADMAVNAGMKGFPADLEEFAGEIKTHTEAEPKSPNDEEKQSSAA